MANKPLIIWSDDATKDNDYYTTWYLNVAGSNISIKFTKSIDEAIN